MKKLISLLIIPTLTLSLILSGCGAKNQIQTQQEQSDAEWFADEVLDVDDWGKKKKVKSSTTKPSTSTKSSTSKAKSNTSKKK